MATIDIQELRYLHKDFARYPPLCVCAKLSGIQPKDGDSYDFEVNKEFYDLCADVDLEVKIVRVHAAVSICRRQIWLYLARNVLR